MLREPDANYGTPSGILPLQFDHLLWSNIPDYPFSQHPHSTESSQWTTFGYYYQQKAKIVDH